jgi:hypothetical protein
MQGGRQVEVLFVQTHVLDTFCAKHTVPHQFGSGEVGGTSRKFTGVVD